MHWQKKHCVIFEMAAARICETPGQRQILALLFAPPDIQRLADQSYELLKRDPKHGSLHFKKVGRFWSARVGIHYRAVAVQEKEDFIGFGSDTIASMSALSSHAERLE